MPGEDEEPKEVWWVIEDAVIQQMLRRARAGEDPEPLYIELRANSRRDEGE